MLYLLEIENFLSIRERQVLDLSIAPNVPDDEDRFAPIFPGSELRAPKIVAIYGANASGKTTVLKALTFLSHFVRNSASPMGTGLDEIAPFADQACANKPISLAMEFGGYVNYVTSRGEDIEITPKNGQPGTLRYELEIEVVDGFPKRVLREALRQRPDGKGKWQRIFERQSDGDIAASDLFPLGRYQHLKETLTDNVSLISSYGRFKHPTARFYSTLPGHSWSNLNAVPGARETDDKALFDLLAGSPEILSSINRDLSRADTGVEKMDIQTFGTERRAVFTHSGLGTDLLWDKESQGTRAFVRLFPLLHLALNAGGLAYIDEFDTLIHPLVLPEILRWFHDPNTRNPRNAQVWMSCHSATLLEDLVKEEVVITEKNSAGRTRVYSLMDVKSTRRDDNLYKKYLGGVYGGVPVIG